jgi:hypothetical protein
MKRGVFGSPADVHKTIQALLTLLAFAPFAQGYSVLSHEALIDAAWDTSIKPILLKAWPDASPDCGKRTLTPMAAPSSRTWGTIRSAATCSAI